MLSIYDKIDLLKEELAFELKAFPPNRFQIEFILECIQKLRENLEEFKLFRARTL